MATCGVKDGYIGGTPEMGNTEERLNGNIKGIKNG